MSVTYLAEVQLGASYSGQTATASPYTSTAGAAPVALASGVTVGTPWEDPAEPGRYGVAVTLASPLAVGTTLRVAIAAGGATVVDGSPTLLALPDVGNVTGDVAGSVGSVTAPVTAGTVSDKSGYSLDPAAKLDPPRDLSAVADADLTVNDARHCAIAAAAGRIDDSNAASLVVQTPAGTTLRTFTVTVTNGVAVARA